jgi:dTMP kinase
MLTPGKFIVLEGGEGSGKSTQATLLADARGALLTREPGGTALGELLRPLLLDGAAGPVDPRAELFLMVAARAQHCAEVILPTLEAGRDVVCDRFSGSTLAYQGFGRGLPIEEVAEACRLAAAGVEPDLTVLLDVPDTLARSRRDRPLDAIERAGAAFHARVLEGFATLAREDPSWVVVDGSGTIEQVATSLRTLVAERLGESCASGG